MSSVVFQENDSPDYYVNIPLISSAAPTRNITVTFTVMPQMFTSIVVAEQVVFYTGARMQVYNTYTHQAI